LGSEKDAESLCRTFTFCGFDVDILVDLTAAELKHLVQISIPNKINADKYCCLVICVLAHGDYGVVKGIDSEPVNIEELKNSINVETCPQLKDNPAAWIMAHCQGGVPQRCMPRSEEAEMNHLGVIKKYKDVQPPACIIHFF